MYLIFWRYIKDNFANLIFKSFIVIYIILINLILKSDNTITIKTLAIMISIGVIILMLFLCYHNRSNYKITISIKDLIKLNKINKNKDYQYQKLIKEEKYKYARYIKYIDKDIQLEIFDNLNKIILDSYYDIYTINNYLQDLINPCYEIVYEVVKNDPDRFVYINKKCKNYNEYEELHEFMTI
jgi:hypothetical protein